MGNVAHFNQYKSPNGAYVAPKGFVLIDPATGEPYTAGGGGLFDGKVRDANGDANDALHPLYVSFATVPLGVLSQPTALQSNGDQVLLPANAARKSWQVLNDSTENMFLRHGGAVSFAPSPGAYDIVVPPGSLYMTDFPGFQGAIHVDWGVAGTGVARVVEFG